MQLHLRLDPVPTASGSARRAVASWLTGHGLEHTVDDVVVLTSELVTNALRHGQGHIEVEVSDLGDAVRVAVTDDGVGLPEPRTPGDDEPTGRGLALVASLSRAWGVDRARPDDERPSSKVVWVEVAITEERQAPPTPR